MDGSEAARIAARKASIVLSASRAHLAHLAAHDSFSIFEQIWSIRSHRQGRGPFEADVLFVHLVWEAVA